MTDRELMQQSLDALTCTGEDDDPGHRCTHCDDYVDRNGPLRAALRERLAQPEQEPVAHCEAGPEHCPVCLKELSSAQQKPVAWRYKPMIGSSWSLSDDGYYISCKRDKGYIVDSLYTAPPQRTWVGLTEAERIDIIDGEITAQSIEHFALVQAIESKLKEKNT